MTNDRLPPLNGEKTHPLTDHAIGVLREISRDPIPSNEVNPGVLNRLFRESLVKFVMLASPYKTHKGKLIRFLQITDAGRLALSSRGINDSSHD